MSGLFTAHKDPFYLMLVCPDCHSEAECAACATCEGTGYVYPEDEGTDEGQGDVSGDDY